MTELGFRKNLLGDLTPRRFLRRHWQKAPLLVRKAIPGFRGVITRARLAELAARHDVESRFVTRRGEQWSVEHGPFPRSRMSRASARNWTLLVNGVNHHCAAADTLLRSFNFIPQARLDDVMVSFAAPGGGVGPHLDSYDVFLIQGQGRRLWRFRPPGEFKLFANAPLRLIENFIPDEEVLVEPGDLLYLPPGWAHDGVALEPSFTYSIGFRAPSGEELAAGFLDWLHERGLPTGAYRDPAMVPARQSAAIPDSLLQHAKSVITRLSWTDDDLIRYMGHYLSVPKAHVVFRNRPTASRAQFVRALPRSLLRLNLKTQLLYRGSDFFINGEVFESTARQRPALARLADTRWIRGAVLAHVGLADLCFEWYRLGFVELARQR